MFANDSATVCVAIFCLNETEDHGFAHKDKMKTYANTQLNAFSCRM